MNGGPVRLRAMSPRPCSVPRSRRRAAALACVGALALGLAACGASNDDGKAPGTASIGEPATVEKTSSTTGPPATTTTAGPAGLAEADRAAAALYTAWKADDRTAAAAVAEQTAVDGIWASAPGDYALYNRCNTGEFDGAGCLYRGSAGTIQFSMEKRDALWVVVEAVFSAP